MTNFSSLSIFRISSFCDRNDFISMKQVSRAWSRVMALESAHKNRVIKVVTTCPEEISLKHRIFPTDTVSVIYREGKKNIEHCEMITRAMVNSLNLKIIKDLCVDSSYFSSFNLLKNIPFDRLEFRNIKLKCKKEFVTDILNIDRSDYFLHNTILHKTNSLYISRSKIKNFEIFRNNKYHYLTISRCEVDVFDSSALKGAKKLKIVADQKSSDLLDLSGLVGGKLKKLSIILPKNYCISSIGKLDLIELSVTSILRFNTFSMGITSVCEHLLSLRLSCDTSYDCSVLKFTPNLVRLSLTGKPVNMEYISKLKMLKVLLLNRVTIEDFSLLSGVQSISLRNCKIIKHILVSDHYEAYCKKINYKIEKTKEIIDINEKDNYISIKPGKVTWLVGSRKEIKVIVSKRGTFIKVDTSSY